jgi:hypothetical protein
MKILVVKREPDRSALLLEAGLGFPLTLLDLI